jgi:hypothetical protein
VIPEHFFAAVRVWCEAFDASITSWKRTAPHNAKVGGVVGSPHLFWLACDVVYDRPRQVHERNILARELGLSFIDEGDHDHLQPRQWENVKP